MSDQTKSAIKTGSQEGEFVNLLDNPDKVGRVKMTNQKLVSEAAKSEEGGEETGKLITYSDILTMRVVLDLTDSRSNSSTAKEKITKAWKKVTKNMENIEKSLQEQSAKLSEEIKLAKEDNDPDLEQIGLLKA